MANRNSGTVSLNTTPYSEIEDRIEDERLAEKCTGVGR